MNFVTLELRPRLQSCNVFICIKQPTSSEEVQVNLIEQNIVLQINRQKYNFKLPLIKIIPNSLSGLNINGDWIYFRVLTKPFNSTFGSFTTEIVRDTKVKESYINNITNNNEASLKNIECLITCTCCTNILSKPVSFERILPLPSADCDPSEWFCCKHNDHNDKDNRLSLLDPQETDCFFAPLFKVMHKNIFRNSFIINDEIICCKRCLSKLGLTSATESFKLWNNSINYMSSKNSELIFGASDPTEDFILAFKTSVSCIFGEIIALESTVGREKHYILIKPMDWHLDLLVEPNIIQETEVNNLKRIPVVKVLYKYRTSITVEKNEIADASHCEVPYPVITAALDYLVLSTKRFPHIYRVANDYYIGYVNLHDCTT